MYQLPKKGETPLKTINHKDSTIWSITYSRLITISELNSCTLLVKPAMVVIATNGTSYTNLIY